MPRLPCLKTANWLPEAMPSEFEVLRPDPDAGIPQDYEDAYCTRRMNFTCETLAKGAAA